MHWKTRNFLHYIAKRIENVIFYIYDVGRQFLTLPHYHMTTKLLIINFALFAIRISPEMIYT